MNYTKRLMSNIVIAIITAYLMSFGWFNMLALMSEIGKKRSNGYFFEGYIIFIIFGTAIYYLFSKKLQKEIDQVLKSQMKKEVLCFILALIFWLGLIFSSLSANNVDRRILYFLGLFLAVMISFYGVRIIKDIFLIIKDWYTLDKTGERKDKNTFLIGCATLVFALINIFK